MNIGYYAHHHGTGHCRQADKLAGHLLHSGTTTNIIANASNNLLTVFTSLSTEAYTFKHISADNIIRLPDEHETQDDILPGRAGDNWQPECLHYSPVANHHIQQRSQILLSQIQSRQIQLMIVDVSVEIALLCRTASIPYLYVRLSGNRNDTPHRNAFQGALGLIAAYPKVLESADTPEWVRQKTLYIGLLPRVLVKPQPSYRDFIQALNALCQNFEKGEKQVLSQNRSADLDREGIAPKPDQTCNLQPFNVLESQPIVTVIKGFGGHKNIDQELPKLRQLLPHTFIISLGPIADNALKYVDLATQVDDVFPFLQHSDLLVMACGLNAIGEACQFNTPLLVVPDARPHDEQKKMAQALINSQRALSLDQFIKFWRQNLVSGSINSSYSSNDLKVMKDKMTRLKASPALVAKLSNTDCKDFMLSIAHVDNVKIWFYQWLLPKLDCQPTSTLDAN